MPRLAVAVYGLCRAGDAAYGRQLAALWSCGIAAAFGLLGNVLVQAAGAIAVGVDGHVGKSCIVYALG